ncbi:MAG: hypothetical protein KDA45_14050 [Planctomycetales bacterium]|nr:hypothetical protein [Planctomycetales bacterium]
MHCLLRLAPALAVGACLSNIAHGHPGHALPLVPADSGWHYLLHPEHGAILLLVAAALLFLRGVHHHQRKQLTPAPARRHR